MWIYAGKKILATHSLSSWPFYYRIIPAVVFGIEYFYFGVNYFFYHIVNISLFILTSLIFYSLGKIIFKSTLASFISAVCFVLSPINLDKVNWIASQSYLWLGIFYLLTIINFYNYLKKTKLTYFVFFNLTFFLALWSNEAGISILPLLIFMYYKIGPRGKGAFDYKSFLIAFSLVFVLTSIYLFKIYHLYFKEGNITFSFNYLFLKTIDLFSFLSNKLSYIFYLLPIQGFISTRVILASVFALLFFLPKNYWEIRFFILWIIISILPFYFAPYGHNGPADLTHNSNYISSMGLFMFLGYSIDKIVSYNLAPKRRILKATILTITFFAVIFFIGYLIYGAKSVKKYRHSDKYELYDNYVKSRYDKIHENFEVYFLDGSNFADITPKENYFIITAKCPGETLDFGYMSFIYHLKLIYGVNSIKAFAVSPKDIPKIINRPNSIIIDVPRRGNS